MVSVNVSQLLLLGAGAVREFDFVEPLPDPSEELHLAGPVTGQARLTRTSDGILVHSDHRARVTLECARCLEPTTAEVEGQLDEEFFPMTDVRSGVPLPPPTEDDQLLIDEHHEIKLDELLRQNILTSLPLQPLCDTACPGLCAVCGERLDPRHTPHHEDDEQPVDSTSPFARLAVLLRDDDSER